MSNLKTLILMQLKDKMDFSYLKSLKKSIFKIVLSILKFVLITGVIYVAFFVLDAFQIVSDFPGIPQNFFNVIFTAIYIISIVVSVMGLVKSLYFSKDNQLILTFPTTRTTLFVSKLLVFYIYEVFRNIYFLMPWFVAYGLINAFPIYFYLWLVVAILILTVLSVVLASLLSIPTMYIYIFIKQYRWLEYVCVAGIIGLAVFGIITIINAIPENFDLVGQWVSTFWAIQKFITKFNKIFLPFTWILTAIVGTHYGYDYNFFSTTQQIFCLLGVIGSILIIIGITLLIVRPLFFKMASTPFEYKKSLISKKYKNKPMRGFASFLKKEMLLTYRTSNKFYGLIYIVLGLPIAIFLLNKIFAAMDTRLTGYLLSIVFNVLMILVIALSSNVSLAHVYSEEGASSYLLKTNPKPYLYSAFAKILVNMVLVSISILVSVIIFTQSTTYTFMTKLLIYLFLEFTYLSHLFMTVDLDVMNPQTAHYQTTGSHLFNPNEIKSTIYGFLMAALMTVFAYFLIMENSNNVWTKLFFISLAFMVLRIWLFVNKVKVYFKERQ